MLSETFPTLFQDSLRSVELWPGGVGDTGRIHTDNWFTPLGNYPALNLSSTDEAAVVTADLL